MKPMAFFSFVAEVEFLRLVSAPHLSRLCGSVLRRANLSHFVCCRRTAATAFSEQPWFRISLRTNLSLCPKRESKDDAKDTKTIDATRFLAACNDTQTISQSGLTLYGLQDSEFPDES